MDHLYDFTQQTFQDILEFLPDGVMVIDKNGFVIYANKRSQELNGKTKCELIGQHVSVLVASQYFSPAASLKCLKSKKTEVITQTLRGKKKILVYAYPLEVSNTIEYVVTVSKDITEQAILKNMLEERDELLSYLNHMYNPQAELDLQYKSVKMQRIYDKISYAAPTDINILLSGESGVGKTYYAKMIHQLSTRKSRPFIVINCSAIPESLLESELFGYEAGSFTGASTKGNSGLFEAANGGTVFLDEIGEIPLLTQVKLLEVLQEKVVRRLGGKKPIPIDFRLITATNQNLPHMIAHKTFRQDLFYRINGLELLLPPLRERKEDLPFLINHFMQTNNKKHSLKKIIPLSVVKLLHQYNWPGNIRELKHVIENAYIMSPSNLIEVEALPDSFHTESKKEFTALSKKKYSLDEMLTLFEQQIIKREYKKLKSSYKVAERLQISQPSAWRKIKKYCGITSEKKENITTGGYL